nr:MAG TPA: Protein of unknown function (DUF550) [Caudoviricetes sp.]
MFNFFKNKKQKPLDKLSKALILENIDNRLNSIKRWHEKTFPDATLAGQLAKLEEEICESLKVGKKDKAALFEEIADILIVCAGLRRFDSKIGISIENNYLNNATLDILSVIDLAIIQKMNKNRKRKWEKTEDGRFHHI